MSTGTSKPGRWQPALTLMLLSPAYAELLSSSAPPLVFFRPEVLLLFVCLYGTAALLIREWTLAWSRGWRSILLLGAGFAMLEEGIAAKSFFDPKWRALGPLSEHGRALGVNWLWTLDLTLFHAAFSVALPILTVHLIYPEDQSRPWTGAWTRRVLGALFLLDLLLFFQKGNSYQAPAGYYAASLTAALGFYLLARAAGNNAPPALRPPVRPLYFAVLGFAASLGFITLIYWFPPVSPHPVVTLTLTLGMAFGSGVMLLRWTSRGANWQAAHQVALLSGALGFLALLAVFQEFNPSRPDPATGMAAVGGAAVAFLTWLGRRTARAALRP
jgi:hypothetical protein